MSSDHAAKTISIREMNKYYGNFHALKGLSLEVEAGEFLVLLGPSGCGKSTALRMIAGLESISSGELLIGDQDVTEVLPKYRDIAMVFQSYALYPHKTVAENIGFPLKMAKVPQAEMDEAVRAAAAQVELDGLLDRLPGQLSGGQRQRVALARAIIRRPAVFLMDEPLSNLDAKLRGNMRAELKHMQNELGITTIYVTHDQIEAMTLAHRVAIMKDGELQQLGTPKEVYSNPANLFVAGFMGSPPMNFVEGEISSGQFRAAGMSLPVTGFADNAAVTIGFRPEDCQVVEAGTGQVDASVYTFEMTGDQSLVTFEYEDRHLVVKMPKDFEIASESRAAIAFDPAEANFFDTASGRRLLPAA
ncbi:ABC transporter ATP-binding protein [Oceanomicrobium pacificus]|uniref:ATP-binding cassette domain-containing protein n=1 Tax=Oceanomicrobium pacificus TaxID=2692916 RepID=A0A6B0TKI5_9RHOB|nr:ABC transporter ATP-binding protein [Oceanomicrobium pacificus]MXU64366.1 ATP-binding cassette domain-containing protein [Oceanomicrobium pacificus]